MSNNTGEIKDALLDFYDNMGQFYDALNCDGQESFRLWVTTGDITPILQYLPATLREYFIDSLKVVTVNGFQ